MSKACPTCKRAFRPVKVRSVVSDAAIMERYAAVRAYNQARWGKPYRTVADIVAVLIGHGGAPIPKVEERCKFCNCETSRRSYAGGRHLVCAGCAESIRAKSEVWAFGECSDYGLRRGPCFRWGW